MKLLIVTPIFPPQIGGPASYTYALAEKLVKMGHQIEVITFSNTTPATITGVSVNCVSTSGNSLARQLHLIIQIFLKSKLSDVVYVHGTIVVGLAGWIVAKIRNKKIVLKFVGDEIWETARNNNQAIDNLEKYYQLASKNIYQTILTNIHRRILKSVNFVIVPSEYLRQFLIQIHHIPEQRIVQINNPVEVSNLSGVSKKTNQLVFVGRLVKWKHVDQIIKALAIANRVKKWNLVVVGSGPEMNALIQLTKELNLTNQVKFVGQKNKHDVHSLIAESTKLVLYSSYEGQSHTLIEAMQLGTSCIASNIKANIEIGKDLVQLVELGNPQALADVINQSVDQNKIYHARKWSRREFNWDHHLSELLEIFKQ